MPTYPLQNFAFAVIAGLPLIAACFVITRIYAKRRFGYPLGWEDYTITVASVLSIALIGPSIRNVQMWHFGIHIYDLDQRKLEPNYNQYHKVLIAYNLIHTPILPLVKVSIILLLLRVGKIVKPIRRSLYAILFFVVGACLGPWIALIFLCPPRTGRNTGPSVFGGLKCIPSRPGAIINLFLVSANMFTDILILPIPSLLMYRVKNTSIRARLTVIFSSALILGATGIGAARLAMNWQSWLDLIDKSDWTYNITFCLNHAENNAAIILSCMPILRTLIIRWSKPQGTLETGTDARSRQIQRDSMILRSTPTPEIGARKTSALEVGIEFIDDDEWDRMEQEDRRSDSFSKDEWGSNTSKDEWSTADSGVGLVTAPDATHSPHSPRSQNTNESRLYDTE